MSESYWRRKSREIIGETIARIGMDNVKELRTELVNVYPFGERNYWPYKVWLDEIQRQMHTGRHAPKEPESSGTGPLMELMND